MGSEFGSLDEMLKDNGFVVGAAGTFVLDSQVSAPAIAALPDGVIVHVPHANPDDALASLPADFVADLMGRIDAAQKLPVPYIELSNIRQVLVREVSGQVGCEGDGFDAPFGRLGDGETLEGNTALCEALVQMVGFVEELMEA